MSNRQFTWWRRFHTSRKLLKDLYWKGYSRLLQRIEFGEFEYDQLSEQTHLEELLYQMECQQIKNEFSYTRDPEIIQEKIRDRRKLKNKRVGIMMEKHLKREAELLSQLRLELAEEFSLDVDYIREYMETFDGTTRQLFYVLRSISQGRTIPTFEQIDLFPRSHSEQPRHILKDRDPIIKRAWNNLVKERKIWNAYGN
jgi:hypothetical protein